LFSQLIFYEPNNLAWNDEDNSTVKGSRMTKKKKMSKKRDQGIGRNGTVKKRNRCRVH